MKVSYNWIKDYLDFDLSPDKVAEILTDTGLEVEGVEDFESVKGSLQGVVIGQVKEMTDHPDADRLRVTKVDVGTGELLNIVCGAPNVATGQKVVVATVGATLHPTPEEDFVIKKSKIRGVESEGMLCAEDELGLGKSHDGIMVLPEDVKVGTPASEFFQVYRDSVLEIGLTPNRTDGFSQFGAARDLAARLSLQNPVKATLPDLKGFELTPGKAAVEVSVNDTDGCIRYTGVSIKNVKVAESPAWLKNKLKAIGIKPKNNVVDVTNFVLHELGQPLHSFDQDKIKGGKIIVDTLPAKTKFTTLDGLQRELNEADLMICDGEGGLCIAGVMGGAESGVSETTVNVFLESACFNPVRVRKSAKRHAINSDSSFRFERGVDPLATLFALHRAAQLICEISGGEINGGYVDIKTSEIKPAEVNFKLSTAFTLMGKAIPTEILKTIFDSLDITILEENTDTWKLQIPTYRVDVTRQVDVVEEILRIYGYNEVEIPQKMNSSISYTSKPDKEKVAGTVADLLASRGFSEMMANGLTQSKYAEWMAGGSIAPEKSVFMLNPLSQDLDALRQTLLGSALEAVSYNQNRKADDLKLFEFGRTYRKNEDGSFSETPTLSITLTGNRYGENWNRPAEDVSFTDIAGEVEAILKRLGAIQRVKAGEVENPYFSDGVSYLFKRDKIVQYGWIDPEILAKFDIKKPVYYAEFDWNLCLQMVSFNKIKNTALPKYPAVRRDLSLLLDRQVRFAEIKTLATKAEGKLLKEVGLFDVYEGKNLEPGKKSYAVSFVLQDEDRTLNDKIIDKAMAKIRSSLEQNLGATLR